MKIKNTASVVTLNKNFGTSIYCELHPIVEVRLRIENGVIIDF